jgi:hypothetical protein
VCDLQSKYAHSLNEVHCSVLTSLLQSQLPSSAGNMCSITLKEFLNGEYELGRVVSFSTTVASFLAQLFLGTVQILSQSRHGNDVCCGCISWMCAA